MKAIGAAQTFMRLRDEDGRLIATQGYFPPTLDAAINQKARWIAGIALSGWDRLGWCGGLGERWMRLRDRQSLLAALLLAAAYLAMLLWTMLFGAELLAGHELRPLGGVLALLLTINLGLLFWRLVMRFGFVTAAYGWREGLRSIPRVIVANAVAMLAARRALIRYRTLRRDGSATWDKTDHVFPQRLPAE